MTDIVERLRGNWAHLGPDDAEEAADEIERLRKLPDLLADEIARLRGIPRVKVGDPMPRDIRTDALEEAAKVADKHWNGKNCIGEAIRALKEKADA